MAIQVPTYREQQVRQSPVSGQKQNISTPDAAFGSLQAEQLIRSGTAVARLGEQWNKRAINIQDEANELTALKIQTDAENELSTFLYDPNDGLLTKKGQNALNAPAMVRTKVQEIQKRIAATPDLAPDVRDMLNKSFIGIDQRYQDLAKRHQLQEYTVFKNDTLNAALETNMNDIALNYMDDKEFQKKADDTFKLLQSRATSEGWGEQKLAQEKSKAYATMRGTQIQAMIATDDPQKIIIAQRVYNEARSRGQMNDFDTALKIEKQLQAAVPKAAAFLAYSGGRAAMGDKESIINFIIDEQEGGATVAQEPNGGTAIYGINSNSFPEFQKNPTRQGAVEIYGRDFWDANKLDDLPENMRLIAMDTVVNHRIDFAKKVVEAIKGGATPDEVLDMRLKEYQRLKADPEYAGYYDGWVNRLQKLRTQTGAAYDASSIQATASELEKRYKGAGAELIALYENDRKQKDAIEKAEKDDVQDQVNQIVSDNGGDWTKVPSPLRARAAALGIDITAYKGVSDPAVTAELDAMPTSQFFALDLNDPKYAAGLTYADKQAYQKKQAELGKPDNKYTSDMVDGIVAYYFRSQKNADPEAKANKPKVAAMKNYVLYKAQAYLEAGKKPTKEDLTKFASEYLTLFRTAGVVGYNDMTIADVPVTVRATIEQGLLEAGREPTETSVLTAFVKMKQAGLIKDE